MVPPLDAEVEKTAWDRDDRPVTVTRAWVGKTMGWHSMTWHAVVFRCKAWTSDGQIMAWDGMTQYARHARGAA